MNKLKCIMNLIISTDTTNPNGNELFLVEKIISYLKLNEYDNYTVLKHNENRASLILCLNGCNPNITVGFLGHLDTVPTGDNANWRYNPFDPVIEDSIIYGRGSTDMGGGLASMILLYSYYADNNITPPVNLKFIFTADEESNGMGITECSKNKYLDDLDYMFVCEPTSCNPVICEKGTLWLNASITGKAAHASMSSDGCNALEYGMSYMEKIQECIESFSKPHYILGKNTCSITEASSGIKINMIPNTASFSADIRIVPNSPGGNNGIINIINDITHYYNSLHDDLDIKTKIISNRESLEISSETKFIHDITESYKKLKIEYKFGGINYFTDASLVIPYKFIPFVILGPGNPRNCHITNEFIDLREIEKSLKIYIQYLNNFNI